MRKNKDLGASADADRAAGLRPQPATQSSQSSIPSAEDEIYRMNPIFREFLTVIGGDIQRAAVAWGIARKQFEPMTPEADFEVWQGDEIVAGCSGPRGKAIAEAVHYAVVYQTDERPCVIQEVRRREIDPDEAHSMIASAMSARSAETEELSPKDASAVGKAETPRTPGRQE